jgi:hypothetical protein
MSNNFLREGNLDDDFEVDEGDGKVRVHSIIIDSGAPSAPPSVPEKAWVYVRSDSTPRTAHVWDPDAAAWRQFANDTAGPGGDGWALEGNALAGTEVLGSTNSEDLKIITNDTLRALIEADGTTRIQPTGVGPLDTTGATQQLFLGDGHPELGTGPLIFSGDLDAPATNPIQYLLFSPLDLAQGEAQMGVDAGLQKAQITARKNVGTEAEFELVALEQDGEEDQFGSSVTGSSQDGVAAEMRKPNGIYAGFYGSVGAGGDEVRASIETGDFGSTDGNRQLELTLGGLRLDNFVEDAEGAHAGGASTEETSVMFGVHKTANADHPEGVYLTSGKLQLAVEGEVGNTAFLNLNLTAMDGSFIEQLGQITLARNTVSGNWEIEDLT